MTDNFNTRNALQAYTGGQNSIPLSSVGDMYFVWPTLNHCDTGMKLAIKVQGFYLTQHQQLPLATSPRDIWCLWNFWQSEQSGCCIFSCVGCLVCIHGLRETQCCIWILFPFLCSISFVFINFTVYFLCYLFMRDNTLFILFQGINHFFLVN